MFHSLLLVACTMLSQAAVVHTARLYHNAKYSSIRFNHWKRCISVATGAGDDLSCPDQGEGPINVDTGDLLLTGLNGAQDISVKVVSCREVVQEAILRNDLSPQAAQSLGELMVSSLMMGANLKNDESLQVNLVGTGGIRHLMVVTDGELKVRGMVGEPRFFAASSAVDKSSISTRKLLGESGQVQVVRNHPTWKSPTNGITALRDLSIPLNLALYMAESEQRPTAILSEVKVVGNLCRYALGIMIERLPGAADENIDLSINNLAVVERKGLRSYLDQPVQVADPSSNSDKAYTGRSTNFRSFEPALDKILDDCIVGMEKDSIRWKKTPRFRCSCGVDRVWRALRLLPKQEVAEMIEKGQSIDIKCEFCGQHYALTADEIRESILV